MGPATTVTVSREDLAHAVIGLGFFIDYRRDEGMADAELVPYMQAYFNLSAHLAGREAPDLAELRSRKVADGPDLQAASRVVLPRWLPDCEKLRIYSLGRDIDPCTDGPRE